MSGVKILFLTAAVKRINSEAKCPKYERLSLLILDSARHFQYLMKSRKEDFIDRRMNNKSIGYTPHLNAPKRQARA